ncbi:MAG: endopeptidase La [Oscillospiraceae bacterium]|jgi:ATP-dependent Lon protease|nr:endopeptidase La [Oscillospiraceae bacterium]
MAEEFDLLTACGCVIYPGTEIYLECFGKEQLKALESAMLGNHLIFFVAQRATGSEGMVNVQKKKLFPVGVLAQIKQILKKDAVSARILIQGKDVASLTKIKRNENGLHSAVVKKYTATSQFQVDQKDKKNIEEALIRTVKKLFVEYAQFFPAISKAIHQTIKKIKSGNELVNYIAVNIMLELSVKQQLLEVVGVLDRLLILASVLEREVGIISCQVELDEKLKKNIDKGQKDYYIREQIKILNSELAGGPQATDEVQEYIKRINELMIDQDSKEHLLKEAQKLDKAPSGSHEGAVIKNYLDICVELPWSKKTEDSMDVEVAAKILDRAHFGLKKIKEKILEMIAVKALNRGTKWQVLCLVGPPGVGKTSIAKAIAEAVNRKYVKVSLGGLKDESEVRGHRKTYVGAMPGRIIMALKTAKSKNPLILLDEIDKMAMDFRSDPTAAFLEVLDYGQNCEFRDNYLEVAFDLSDVLFVATANYLWDIPAPLLNRMEVVELDSYTRYEKFNILKKHVIPKQLTEYLLAPNQIKFSDAVIRAIVDNYTREAGVRSASRLVGSLCRKAIRKMLELNLESFSFTVKNLKEYAGVPKYSHRDTLNRNVVGTATGLAWTQVGGETMCIEALSLEGTGKLELTGSLGSVMQESAKAALSYIRKVSGKLKINKEFYKNSDIHLHVPSGAVPKDGPSAGTAISTAIVSELMKKPIRKDVAITGEITLRGKVLPVGGVKEKVIAAHKMGIKMVVLPKENEADLEEVDESVKDEIEFVFAKNVDTVWKTAVIGYS